MHMETKKEWVSTKTCTFTKDAIVEALKREHHFSTDKVVNVRWLGVDGIEISFESRYPNRDRSNS